MFFSYGFCAEDFDEDTPKNIEGRWGRDVGPEETRTSRFSLYSRILYNIRAIDEAIEAINRGEIPIIPPEPRIL